MFKKQILSGPHNPIAWWMLLGVFAVFIQIMLGGITRLTGSGLSITEWQPIMGVVPPMNEVQWQEAFEKYKHIPQFEVINSSMSLEGFKVIFFWEWFHRLWARSAIFLVFIFGSIYFYFQRRIDSLLLKRLILLFTLGAFEGLMGWIMVQSGLKDNIWVNHLKLTIHLLIGLSIISYLLWLTLEYWTHKPQLSASKKLRAFAKTLIILLAIQLAYGGIMAGLKAALSYNTWPLFGNSMFPTPDPTHNFLYNLFNDRATVQIIHRNFAYLVALISIWFAVLGIKERGMQSARYFIFYPVIIFIQVLLGILILLNTPTGNMAQPIPVVLGVLHQLTGVTAFLYTLFILYIIQPLNGNASKIKSSAD